MTRPLRRRSVTCCNLQNNVPGDTADCDVFANSRTGNYAIMALHHYDGVSDNIYFFE